MGFGNFKTAVEVAKTFKFSTDEGYFVDRLPFEIPEYEKERIRKKIADPLSFISEESICERVIGPVLDVLDDHYKDFRVWSHVTYNVDPTVNLSGKPDFLVAPTTNIIGEMGVPPLCVIEAKRLDWDNAWAQAAAEMYAASTQGATMCYAVVTSGKIWQFGKFDKKDNLLTQHRNSMDAIDQPPATDNLQKIFDILNWIFNEASNIVVEKK